MAAEDIDARMAEIAGRPPRLAPLAPEALDMGQMELIQNVRGAAGSDPSAPVPEFFLVAVKHPGLFRSQMAAGTLFFRGTIPPRERELAILRVAWTAQAPYEWGEHVEIGKRCGLTGDEIERVTAGSDADGWSPLDAAILRGVEELMARYSLSDATWDALAAHWSEQQLLEFPLLIGAYVGTAFQQNTLRIPLSATNRGLAHR